MHRLIAALVILLGTVLCAEVVLAWVDFARAGSEGWGAGELATMAVFTFVVAVGSWYLLRGALRALRAPTAPNVRRLYTVSAVVVGLGTYALLDDLLRGSPGLDSDLLLIVVPLAGGVAAGAATHGGLLYSALPPGREAGGKGAS